MLSLVLGAWLLGAPPGPAVPAPSLRVGDELIYTGDAVEESTRPGQNFRRHTKLEVRFFVFAVREGMTPHDPTGEIHPPIPPKRLPMALDIDQVERLLAGEQIRPALIEECRRTLLSEIAPIDDARSTRQYRERVAQNLLEEFLKSV